MADEPALSGVEELKESSDYLRDPLVAEFAAGGTHISDAAYQILKFHGSYQQDDRDVRNDRRKAGAEFDFGFMVRLRLPGGDIPAQLWLALDDLATEFSRSTIRLTTRQSVQLHFIPKGDLRTVIRQVNAHLASTLGACGDVNRNVMSAPLPRAGGPYQVAREAGRTLADALLPRTPAYAELWLDGAEMARIAPAGDPGGEVEPLYGRTYLPRKFKTCVTVAGDNSVDLFTHDLGCAGIFDGDRLEGWNIYVGGGLGRTHRKAETFPRLADPLGFITPDRLVATASAVVTVQRDHGDRTNRRHGRLKYLIVDRGIEWFRSQVEAVAGFALEPVRPIDWNRSDDQLGWHPQGDGRWAYGLRILNGRVRDDGVRLRTALRAIAEREVDVRVTPNQNLYLLDVEPADRAVIDAILGNAGVAAPESVRGLRRLAMACPALPTCGLAIAEAERALPAVLDQLQAVFDDAGLPELTPTVRMTGCPNGCARPYVAEIGLVGDAVDRYQVLLGGDRAGTRLAAVVGERVHKRDLPDLLRPLVERYRDERLPDEVFGDFVARAQITSLGVIPTVADARAAAAAAALREESA